MNIFSKVTNHYSEKKQNEEKESTPPKPSITEKDMEKMSMVEFKSQSYASYYNTAMEKDKSILTLSVAGIGFLVTLLKLEDSIAVYQLFLFAIAAISFLVSIYSVITLFGENGDFIIDLINDRDVTLKQHKLRILDRNAIYAFYLAIVMSLALGISTSSSLVNIGDKEVTKENDELVDKIQKGELEPALDSFQGAVDFKKSFASADGLKPNTNQQPSNQSNQGAADLKPKLSKDE